MGLSRSAVFQRSQVPPHDCPYPIPTLKDNSSLRWTCRSRPVTMSNYDIGNREILDVKLALEEWRHWLEGAKVPFIVWTDHKNLQYLQTAKRLNWSWTHYSSTPFYFCHTPRNRHIVHTPESPHSQSMSHQSHFCSSSPSLTSITIGSLFQVFMSPRGTPYFTVHSGTLLVALISACSKAKILTHLLPGFSNLFLSLLLFGHTSL